MTRLIQDKSPIGLYANLLIKKEKETSLFIWFVFSLPESWFSIRALFGMFSTRGRGGRAGGSVGAGPRAVSLFRRISRALPIFLMVFFFFLFKRSLKCSQTTLGLYHCCYDWAMTLTQTYMDTTCWKHCWEITQRGVDRPIYHETKRDDDNEVDQLRIGHTTSCLGSISWCWHSLPSTHFFGKV